MQKNLFLFAWYFFSFPFCFVCVCVRMIFLLHHDRYWYMRKVMVENNFHHE